MGGINVKYESSERYELKKRNEDEQLKAMVATARFKQMQSELAMHGCAEEDFEGFERQVYGDWKSCMNPMAKMCYAKLIADIRRLGKREPASATAIGNQTNVTINIVQAPQAVQDAIGDIIPIVGTRQRKPKDNTPEQETY